MEYRNLCIPYRINLKKFVRMELIKTVLEDTRKRIHRLTT